jgi:aminopeptidase N
MFLVGCTNPTTQTPPTTSTPTQPATTPVAELPTATPGRVVDLAGMGDPYYDKLGNAGYDVSHYTIALTIDPITNAISGTTTVEAKATQRLNSLNLDFQDLTIDTLQVNAAPATFSVQDHELTIVPQQSLANGDAFSISVTYHGNPQPVKNVASNFFSPKGWFHSANGAINVMNEPNGAAGWFPVNDHPRDKATYRFEITVPKPWVVAASGTLRETIDDGSQIRYIWEMDKPMASYLASINVGQYVVETSQGPGGVAIRNYLPPDLAGSLKKNVGTISNMIEYLNGLFGPYPFDEYGVVIADSGIAHCRRFFGAAFEAQTLSVHCVYPLMLDESVLVHELAHQWFGNAVSLENWQDIWLKEGMATYAEWLWQTRGQDVNALTALANEQRNSYQHDSKIGQPPADELYDWEVYIGGAQVFHALRLQVGDETFFKILRTYLERYRYGNAGTDEFIAVAEEISGQELSAFFDSWLMQTTLPEMPTPSQ